MLTIGKSCLLVAIGVTLLAAGCQDTSTKNAVAVYSYSAGPYSETVTLRPDGRYVQSETQQGGNPALGPQAAQMLPLTFKQSGTWRLLDGPGGKPLPLPSTAEALPRGAVIELHKAMPFGLTWENRPPQMLESDRTIPAGEFSIQHRAP